MVWCGPISIIKKHLWSSFLLKRQFGSRKGWFFFCPPLSFFFWWFFKIETKGYRVTESCCVFPSFGFSIHSRPPNTFGFYELWFVISSSVEVFSSRGHQSFTLEYSFRKESFFSFFRRVHSFVSCWGYFSLTHFTSSSAQFWWLIFFYHFKKGLVVFVE